MKKRTVLSADDLSRAITRISHEIVEANHGVTDLVLLGIPTRGLHLAQRLAKIIKNHSGAEIAFGSIDVTLYRDDLANQPTRGPGKTSIPGGSVSGKVVVLVDDVLYSGRTARAALDALNDFGRPSSVKLAVLVDRGHRELPIRADFVGKNIPTSASEHISVKLLETDGVDEVVIES